MKRTLGQAGGKFTGLAVVLMLAAVLFFPGIGCERLKAEKLKEAAGQNQRLVPDLRSTNDYFQRREKLLKTIPVQGFFSAPRLNASETNVDRLMDQVRSLETSNFNRLGQFPPAQMFFHVRPAIEGSRLFPIFQRLPKGGLLHVHESSSGRSDFVITNIARRADCYIGWSTQPGGPRRGRLKFTNAPPADDGGLNGYFPFSILEARLRSQGVVLTDELRHLYMLDETDLQEDKVWAAFGTWWSLLPDLMRHRPVLRDFLRDAFQTFHEDGISHVELRVMVPVATMFDYHAGGLVNFSERETLQEYLAARDFICARFNPHFSIRLVLCGLRGHTNSDAATVLGKVREYGNYFPGEHLIAGCDFVGNEDGGRPTLAEVPAIRAATAQAGAPIQFYFHAGESARPGNDNLVDAVLLETKRIGHGFNLFRLPALEPLIRTNRIALEICPISNQLLRLSPDLRTHPAAGYIHRGLPCVLGSDDPAIFGNTGLSYDFWEAYYAWGLDLRMLKQFAESSLTFSALEPDEKSAALARWHNQWDAWVRWVETQSF